jgi:hypothetical protein
MEENGKIFEKFFSYRYPPRFWRKKSFYGAFPESSFYGAFPESSFYGAFPESSFYGGFSESSFYGGFPESSFYGCELEKYCHVVSLDDLFYGYLTSGFNCRV